MLPTTLSAFAVTVALLSLLVGILTQAINTGKAFGRFQVPAAAMVWLTIILPFVAGVGASLQQSGALTAASIFNALVSGIGDVVAGASPGLVVHAAVHAHLNVPQLVAKMRAPASPPKPAGFAHVGLLAALAAVAIGCALFGKVAPPTVAAVGCIVDDAAAGKTIAQIVTDCGGDVAQVVTVLMDPGNAAEVAKTPARLEAERTLAVPVGK